MQEFFDRIRAQFSSDLPFACYHKPNAGKVTAYLQFDAALHQAKFDDAGFVLAPFFGAPVLLPQRQCDILQADWSAPDVAYSGASIEGPQDGSDFEQLVAKGIRAIGLGQFQKVVLSRKESVTLVDFDPVAAFARLALAYPTAFSYCFFHPKIGLWLGATPEKLLTVRTDKFETVALAGTQKFEGDPVVSWAQKEQQEQQFVTDFIMENLESVTTDIAFSDPYTYKAGNLLHLKTDISGTLSDASSVRHLIELLHPTPAVCGLPKEAAREFILDNEGYDRKYYSGYLGELHADFHSADTHTDLFVNLRCMEVVGGTAQIYVGCGITKDSDPEKEFIETVNKAMTIKKIL